MPALRLWQILHSYRTGPELQGGVAVLIDSLVRNNLALVELQHRNGYMLPVWCEHPRHAQLLCDDTCTHRFNSFKAHLELDLNIDTRRQVELHQGIDRLRRGIDNVQKAAVRPHLELLSAFLVDMRGAIHREPLDARRQRHGSAHLRPGSLCRVYDLARRRIENAMVERLEPDPDIGSLHLLNLSMRRPETGQRTFPTLRFVQRRRHRRCGRLHGWQSAVSPPWQ